MLERAAGAGLDMLAEGRLRRPPFWALSSSGRRQSAALALWSRLIFIALASCAGGPSLPLLPVANKPGEWAADSRLASARLG